MFDEKIEKEEKKQFLPLAFPIKKVTVLDYVNLRVNGEYFPSLQNSVPVKITVEKLDEDKIQFHFNVWYKEKVRNGCVSIDVYIDAVRFVEALEPFVKRVLEMF